MKRSTGERVSVVGGVRRPAPNAVRRLAPSSKRHLSTLMNGETNMSTEHKPTLEGQYPLPEGVKLRTRKFGANPMSSLISTPPGGDRGDSSPARTEFKIRWEDQEHGLTVLIRERRDSGHLIADVFCTDAGRLNNLAVSVALVGTVEDQMIRKTIPLNVPEKTGCSGSADFGLLTDAVKELGAQLGVVVFMLV
jgi:hypothetical protein